MIKQLDLSAHDSGLREEILHKVQQVFETQQFVLGCFVDEFERACEAYLDVRHAVAVASGSDALYLSLMAMGIKRGDRVITTPFTFFATVSAITRLGAFPVFVDIEPDTFNIAGKGIEQALKRHRGIKAILPVHLYGRSADMEAITGLAKEYGVRVVEDAAQAFGARCVLDHGFRKAGTVGDAGCFSFYPTKNLGAAGDAGMVVTNDDRIAGLLRMLRVHGSPERYLHTHPGINSRMDGLQAAVLSVKLGHIERWNHTRMELARRYTEMFRDRGLDRVITLPEVPEDATHIFHQYTIRVRDRDTLREALRKDGIGTEVYYPIPLHLQPVFRYLKYRKGSFRQAEVAAQQVLSLPLYPELSEDQQREIVDALQRHL